MMAAPFLALAVASPLLPPDGYADLERGPKCCLCVGDSYTGYQLCKVQTHTHTSCDIACDVVAGGSGHLISTKEHASKLSSDGPHTKFERVDKQTARMYAKSHKDKKPCADALFTSLGVDSDPPVCEKKKVMKAVEEVKVAEAAAAQARMAKHRAEYAALQ